MDIEDSWIVDLRVPGLEVEYGTNEQVRLGEPEMIDEQGEAQPLPRCPKCGEAMNFVIGKDYNTWICMQECAKV